MKDIHALLKQLHACTLHCGYRERDQKISHEIIKLPLRAGNSLKRMSLADEKFEPTDKTL